MVNTNLLKGKIAESGYNQTQLAKELGMSKTTLSWKIRGISDFTISEVIALCKILNITNPEKKAEIFLS